MVSKWKARPTDGETVGDGEGKIASTQEVNDDD